MAGVLGDLKCVLYTHGEFNDYCYQVKASVHLPIREKLYSLEECFAIIAELVKLNSCWCSADLLPTESWHHKTSHNYEHGYLQPEDSFCFSVGWWINDYYGNRAAGKMVDKIKNLTRPYHMNILYPEKRGTWRDLYRVPMSAFNLLSAE